MTALAWKVHTPNLLRELVENNPSAWACRIPVMILQRLLIELAERAIAVDDPELNSIMLRLQLYDVDPREIDAQVTQQLARKKERP